MKIRTFLICMILCLSMVLPIVGCNGQAEAEVIVWEAPNTVKILRDIDYQGQYAYGDGASLTYELAQGESEGAQLILTAKTGLGRSYRLETSDLVSGTGAWLGQDLFAVYHQKYINVERPTSATANMPLGYYPDALLPQEAAVAYNENVLADGQNRGIWVTLTAKDAEPGLYSGNFTLILGEERIPVPVSVRIWNFEISEENHVRSSFYLFRDYLMNGELDCTPEMYEKYVDFLLDYRVSTESLPVFGDDLDSYIEYAKKYAADPRCSAYNLYMEVSNVQNPEINKFGPRLDLEKFEKYIRALAENSTPECNLLKKLYFYVPGLDEPHTPTSDRMAETKLTNERIIDKLIEIADSYTAAQLESFGLVRDDIVGIEHVVTAPYRQQMEGVRTFCPLVSEFNSEVGRLRQQQAAENAYPGADGSADGFGTTWWYVANIPTTPYPTYHIDDNLISSRIMSWMQMDYGINGILYWSTACYVEVSAYPVRPRDPYEDPNAFIMAQGDGFLVYPGAPYGIDGPVGSLRLESIRDGFEDYEYLYTLRGLLETYAEKYNIDITFDEIVRKLYDQLYTGTVPYTDPAVLKETRAELAGLIELLSGKAHAVISLDEVDAMTSKAKVSVYAAKGTEIEVPEGTKEIFRGDSGEGIVYRYEINLDQPINNFTATLTKDGESISVSRFLSNKVKSVNAFDEEADLSIWEVSEGTDAQPGYENHHMDISLSEDFAQKGSALKWEIRPYQGNSFENVTYKPYIKVSREDFFGTDMPDSVDTIEFWVYNDSKREVELSVRLEYAEGSSVRQHRIANVTLIEGWNHVVIPKLYDITWEYLNEVTSILFEVSREDTDVQTLYLDNLFYTYKV